jgi:hypothetical protein
LVKAYKKHNNRIIPSEHTQQSLLIEWSQLVEKQYPELRLLYAVPNGGLRSARTAAALKREGMKAGVPDLVLPVARRHWHSLYLELKAGSGRLSENQKRWIDLLSEQGNLAAVAYSFEEAKGILVDYLEGRL